MALSTARTITPTSAKTANPMLAIPKVASQLPLDEYYAKLLPGDKVNQVEKLLNDPNVKYGKEETGEILKNKINLDIEENLSKKDVRNDHAKDIVIAKVSKINGATNVSKKGEGTIIATNGELEILDVLKGDIKDKKVKFSRAGGKMLYSEYLKGNKASREKLKDNPLKNVPLGDETKDFFAKWGNAAKDAVMDAKDKGQELYHNVRSRNLADEVAEDAAVKQAVDAVNEAEYNNVHEEAAKAREGNLEDAVDTFDEAEDEVEDKVRAAVEEAKKPLE